MGSRKRGGERRPSEGSAVVSREFGPCLVLVHLRTGVVRVVETDEVGAADRNEATGWAIRQLVAAGLPVNSPLTLRDAMWG
jgi:hypothetical protein